MKAKASQPPIGFEEAWRSERARLAKEFRVQTPALRHMPKRPTSGHRLSLPFNARRFCARVNRGERDYVEPGRLLRDFLIQNLSEEAVLTHINRELKARPTYWRLRLHYMKRVPKFGSRFVLDRGDNPEDAWRNLAVLMGDGATFGRFRVCALEACGKLCWDGSAPGRKRYCSEKHRNLVNQRRSRQRRRGRA